MEFAEISSFLNTTADKLEEFWDIKCLSNIANQRVPDFVMSGRGTLLRADIHILWTQWFIESICDPDLFANSNQGYAHIFTTVQRRVPVIFSGITEEERNKISTYIARLVDKEIQRRKTRKRIFPSLDDKKLLWDIYGPEQRCWICGYKFTKWAENKFLGYTNYNEAPLPLFVDYMTLHGLKERHICVEVDHAVPFSKGGDEEDNLRLACGWCNSHKSNRVSLYDVSLKPRTLIHPKLGKQSIPHPFWIVRLLSIRRSCEYEGGCHQTIENGQLTVFPRHPEGAINPTNLRVICPDHDPLGSNRFVSSTIAKQVR
ncbi:MAG: HNH endonuclease signature motif containing protein [Nostoc sp.]|uniref:HNH endonuclease n=1 Tax=Nostoc sp. TaxID=1180 RepID=UPI002FF68999